MSVLKLPFLLSVTWGIHTSMTPPQPPPPKAERLKPVGLERVAPWLPIVAKASFWVLAACETSVILAHNIDPSHPLSTTVLHLLDKPGSAGALRVSPLFLTGWLLNLTGAFIRRHCYRVMDKFFTFELSIRKDHHLITTGAYSVVRHPSYTGGIMSATGVLLCHLSRGSWFMECSGLVPNSWMTFGSIAGLFIVVATMGISSRVKGEEAMLKQEFGKEWEQWAEKVPYKMIPYIL